MMVDTSGSGRRTITVEAEDVLSSEAYEAIRQVFWVLAWKNEHDAPSWWDWCYGASEPMKVPNPQMFWRRPTYAEAAERQRAYDDDPDRFRKLCGEYSKAKYHRAVA